MKLAPTLLTFAEYKALGDKAVADGMWRNDRRVLAEIGHSGAGINRPLWNSKQATVIIWLIGIVVTEAGIGVFSCHASPLVHPTIIGEMNLAEGVVVTDVAKIDEEAASSFHKLDFVERIFVCDDDAEWEFKAGEHSGEFQWLGRCAAFRASIDGFTRLYRAKTYCAESNFVRRSCAGVLSGQANPLIGSSEILNFSRSYPDVGAQLSALSILAYTKLVGAEFGLFQGHYKESKGNGGVDANSNGGNNLDPKFPGLAIGILIGCFFIFFGKGYERFVYRGQLFGAIGMFAGWLFGVAALVMFIGWFLHN